MAKLTDKQNKFIEEYIIDLNATQAAIRAGYSEHSARQIASEMLSKLYIKEELEKRIKEKLKDTTELSLKIINEYKKIAFSDISDYIEFDGDTITFKPFSDIDTTAIKDFESEILKTFSNEENSSKIINSKLKLHSKLQALEALSKYVEIIKDTIVLQNPDGSNISLIAEEIRNKLLK